MHDAGHTRYGPHPPGPDWSSARAGRRRTHRHRSPHRAGRARRPPARTPHRGRGRLGRRVRRARPREGQADRARAHRARSSDPGTRAFEVGTFVNYGDKFGNSESPARRRGHRLRARRRPLVHGHRQRQHRRVAAPGGRSRRRRSSARRPWRCACACRWSTSSTARACSCPSRAAAFPGRTGAGHIFKMNALLVGRRRAADRGRVRRLHRGRRLHADHQRPRLHDRAGLHGHRRRGADQRREEPEAHRLDIGGPEVHVHQSRLRRRARARRRRPRSRCLRARGRAPADVRRRLLPPRRRRRSPPRFAARPSSPALFPTDHREVYDADAGARAPGRPERCSGRCMPDDRRAR